MFKACYAEIRAAISLTQKQPILNGECIAICHCQRACAVDVAVCLELHYFLVAFPSITLLVTGALAETRNAVKAVDVIG